MFISPQEAVWLGSSCPVPNNSLVVFRLRKKEPGNPNHQSKPTKRGYLIKLKVGKNRSDLDFVNQKCITQVTASASAKSCRSNQMCSSVLRGRRVMVNDHPPFLSSTLHASEGGNATTQRVVFCEKAKEAQRLPWQRILPVIA